MSSEFLSVAVVSGKGGVGKTILASNLAWGFSRVSKTILVDLDFQNQGATGLYATHFRFTDANALAAIRETQDEDLGEFTNVADGLAFMPSVPLGLDLSHQQIVESISAPLRPHALARAVSGLVTRAAEGGATEARLVLNPPELGQVRRSCP